ARGHRRSAHVTPRQFALKVQLAPVETLTRCFERARYSEEEVGPEQVAACLEALREVEICTARYINGNKA
ncbi:MAG: DUF4129 domain-containing protein, partial [Candidatus Eremiobacterota bacterium]